jgi:acetyltransferase-like isoleucine patch superfamily enzyme/dTDP-4-dehydrorhamnose 3,5-epimerase-like enzyme
MSNDFFVHEKGICESPYIGKNTRIWAFAHILPKAKIGENCNICDNVFVENDVVIGNNVTIKCGVQLWDGNIIEDNVFIGPNVTFTNDPFPRSKKYPESFSKTIVRQGASIGANATILPGIEIGRDAMVGAGAVVTMSVPPFAVVVGNPARIASYIGSGRDDTFFTTDNTSDSKIVQSRVKGVTLHNLNEVLDIRGNLSVAEFQKEIPFIPKRYFIVYSVPSEKVRGQHAHKVCQQFLLCLNGTCAVLVDDGISRQEYLLDKPNKGIYIPPMVWGVQYKYKADAVLLVFASHEYDNADYIRSYDEWSKLVSHKQ